VCGTIPDPSGSQSKKGRTAGSQKESKASIVAKLLLSGSSIKDIITLDPGYSLQNLIKMRTFASASVQLFESAQQAQWPSNLQYLGGCSLTLRLVEWLNLNLGCKRPMHQKQLYLHGPTSMRKTTFLNIAKFFSSSYAIPTGEDFYDLYQDPEPTLCYIDEYEGKETKPLGWLKQYSQGTEMNLRQKGGQRMKRTNPALIILSNYSLEQVYRKALLSYPTCLDPIYKRFEVIEATSPIDNQGLLEALALALSATTPPASAVILEKLRNLLTPSISNLLNSATSTVIQSVTSPVGVRFERSASPVEQEASNVIVDGTEMSSLLGRSFINDIPINPTLVQEPTGVLQSMMQSPILGMQTISAKPSKHERFMQMRREKIREQQTEKVSSLDLIRRKGNILLYDGNDDHLFDL